MGTSACCTQGWLPPVSILPATESSPMPGGFDVLSKREPQAGRAGSLESSDLLIQSI